MADGKQDLRVQKTQRALVSAMLTLLERHSFGKISVNDICTEAMVSRSAFYTHFEDKYALLGYCLRELNKKTFRETSGLGIQERIANILRKVEDNSRIFKNLLLSELDTELLDMMRRSFMTDFEKMLDEKRIDKKALPGPVDVIATYYAAGVSSSIIYWLRNGRPYTVEEMAVCLSALIPAARRLEDMR